jgi:hypothetical protein
LNATYKAYIKPALQYDCEALITATPAILNKLEVIQNQALRLITGAVKSTPLASMQVLTRNNPLKIEREKMTLILYEKLIRLPHSNCWYHYKLRQKSQNSKWLHTKNSTIMRKVHSSGRNRKTSVTSLSLKLYWSRYKLNLLQELKKRDTDQSVMKLAALEAVHILYPEEEWLHIYIDGGNLLEIV